MLDLRSTWPPVAILVVLAFMLFATGCELEEPQRPTFLPTPTPTPVFPDIPIDSGINETTCETLSEGLSASIKSNLRYSTELTFRRGMADLEKARNLIDESKDPELGEAINMLLESIEINDVSAARTASDTAVRRCKELGYRLHLAPSGFAVW